MYFATSLMAVIQITTVVAVVMVELTGVEPTRLFDSDITDRFFLSSTPLQNGDYMNTTFVGHSSDNFVTSILKLIKVLHWNHTIILFENSYSYHLQTILPDLVLTSVHDLDDFRDSVEMKQFLQHLHAKFFPRLHFLLLANSRRALELLRIVDSLDLESDRTTDFRHHSFWIVACCRQCYIPTRSLLPNIHGLENIIQISSCGTGSSAIQLLMTTPEGRYLSGNRDLEGIKDQHDVFPNTKYGLNNRTLIVSLKEYVPCVMKKGNEFEGYCIDFLNIFANTMNFSYEIVHPEGMRWGEIVDGKWDGLVGQLERREVDLVVTLMTIHEDREKVMDFLYPPIITRVDDIMYKLHEDDQGNWRIYLEPISSSVLLTLSVTFVVSTVIGYTLIRYDDAISDMKTDSPTWIWKTRNRMFIISDTIFYMFGILLLRGVNCQPRNQSTRLFLFAWGIFSVIIATCYTANLVAIFTVKKPTLPFTSLGELVRQKEYKWGLISGSIREHIFNMSRTDDMKLAWKGVLTFNKTDPEVLSEDHSVHIAKVIKEKYAYIATRYTIKKAMSQDCNIRLVGQDINWNQYSFGVPNNYPLRKDLEDVLSVLIDSGLPDIWWQRWGRTAQCIEDQSVKTLTIKDVTSIFYFLCVGLGASCVILLMEVIKHKHQHSSH